MRRVRVELVKHVGGKPSATQNALIDRAAWLTLYVARMDAKALADGKLSEHASREYLGWSASLTRTLARLGLAGVAEKHPTPAQYWAAKAASASPASARPGAPA